MVKSILDPNINYPEIKTLDLDDKDYDATQYEYNILGIDVIIALGQSKYTFIDQGIIFYPIYLIKKDRVYKQIGVFEILESQLPNVIDDDDDLDLDLIDKPLIFDFVNIELLKSVEHKKVSIDNNDIKKSTEKKELSMEEDEIEDDEEHEAEDDADQEKQYELPIQDTRQVEKELNEYTENKSNPWVQEYFKSNNYNLEDNEGGGDCLFAVVRDALKSIDKEISITELRKKLADNVNEELYNNYKEKYDMVLSSIHDTDVKMKQLNKLNNELRDRLKQSKERDEQKLIIEQAKHISESYKRLKGEIKISKEILTEFKMMKKVNSIEDFKKVIKTCEFWADDWAISTLERILNIKLILFSSEAWKEGDNKNVLICGQIIDNIMKEEGLFEPQYYILADYTGNHYKLITYMNHKIFHFPQIPYKIKLLISESCLRGESGAYKIIPQFKKFNSDLGIIEPDEILVIEDSNNLYDKDIVFQYYIKSNSKPLPGKGKGEQIPFGREKEFSKLAEIVDWRKKLDNEYPSEFELDGHKWYSVEHYINAAKFKETNPEYYLLFSIDSKSKISNDIGLAKAAGSKTGKYKGEVLRSKNIKIDPNFFGGKDEKALEDALYAKFSQNEEMRALLLNSYGAKLQHFQGSAPPKNSDILMLVRNKLIKEYSNV